MNSARGIAIATHGLGFVYPDGTRALARVDLEIAAGSRVAIVGQNGSGKSTLVRHFNGLLRATEGRVLVDGREVGQRHVAELARQVGIAFQNPDRQIFASRVRREVEFGPRNIGTRGDDLQVRVTTSLEQVGLADRADVNPYDLGYSERKLLGLASVVAMGTPAIVLDEPTTGQDYRGLRLVGGLVEALARDGRTVIAITHDMEFAARHFERIVVMSQGTVVLDGPPETVFAGEQAAELASTGLF